DAVTRGTVDGAQLLVNIVAMLVVLVALVSLANQVLGLLPEVAGAPVTLQRLFGIALAPLVWIMGIPWAEATTAGALMGTKTVLNELLAYLDLAKLPESALSPRSRLMMTYALCCWRTFEPGSRSRTTPRPVGAVAITFTLRSGRYFLRMRTSRHMSPLQNVVRRSRSAVRRDKG